MEDYSDVVMTLCTNDRLNITKCSANRNNMSLGGGGMICPGFSSGVQLMKEVQYFIDYDVSKKKINVVQ